MARKKVLEKKHAICITRGSAMIDGKMCVPAGEGKPPKCIMVDDSVLKTLRGSSVINFHFLEDEKKKSPAPVVEDDFEAELEGGDESPGKITDQG